MGNFDKIDIDTDIVRHNIFFNNKGGDKVLAATFDKSQRIFISPAEIDDAIETYEHLSQFIDIDEAEFLSKANKGSDDEYEVIVSRIDDSLAKEIKDRINLYGVSGVHFEPNEKRIYPLGSIGSHILGFVGFNGLNEYKGIYGLEASYDKILSTPIISGLEHKSFIKKISGVVSASEESGGDLYTSIEYNVQKQLENVIKDINVKWNSQETGAIVMDPHTGDIIAMSAVPTFNPNKFNKEKDFTIFNNPIVESVYEMGSIFKPITIAIGLDSNSITLDDTYDDKGTVTINTETISNFDNKARGSNTTIQDIISKSLNTGVAFVVEKTGKDIFQSYMKSFDFGSPTGIDLPREIGGITHNLDSPRLLEYVTASYGHGIATTPIGTIKALATLANGGKLITPRIVKELNRNGTQILNVKSKKIDIFEKDTTDKVTQLLIKGFDESLLGGTLKDSNYTFATKTGTALSVNSETGEYFEDKRLHSFFGYFPATEPEYIILLYTLDPKGVEYASDTLAVPFKELADFMITYYQIPPDRIAY